MQEIRITLDNPIIGELDQKLSHVATSYQISRTKNFENEDELLVNVKKDTENKLELFVSLNIEETDIIYTRTKFHFESVDGTEHDSNWSRITPAYATQVGIKISSSIVGTPDIRAKIEEDMVYIDTSKFNMYSGPGEHISTDYCITTTDNEVIYTRDNDEDNLESIYVNSRLEEGKIYSVMARHNNNTNNTSNYGRKLIANYTPDHLLFKFDAATNLVMGRRYYYRVKIWVTNFATYDLLIKNRKGEVVKELLAEPRVTHNIICDRPDFVPNETYYFWMRLNFKDGTSTEYKLVNKEQILLNTLTYFNSNVNYPNKYKDSSPIRLGNVNCITTRETFDNRIISLDVDNNKLNLYTVNNGDLVYIDTIFDLNSSASLKGCVVSYLNVLQLYNGDILVDAVLYKPNRKPSSMFLLFEFNPIRLEMTLLGQLVRTDEKYCTSVSNSLCIAKNGFVYYIPAYLTNGRTQDKQKLTLRKLDINKLADANEPNTMDNLITDIELPFIAKGHVTIAPDRDGTLYVFGGTNIGTYEKDQYGRNTEVWETDNNKVYKLDHNSDTLHIWCSLPLYLPREVYCLQPIMRVDGKLMLFNGCWSGRGLDFNKFITFEPEIMTFEEFPINGNIGVPVRSNIVFQDGIIKRIASKTVEVSETEGNTIPSSCVEFVNTKGSLEIPNIKPLVYDSLDLNVPAGEVVSVEDIYRYNNFNIEPGGILRWHRPQGIMEFGYKDLIVNKDMDITMEEFNQREYNSVLVLQGVNFRILTGKPRSEEIVTAI